MLKCNKYNYTFVHRDISFESALLDSLMYIKENPNSNVLLGGLDEMSERYYRITKKAGYWNRYSDSSNNDEGSLLIPGEGASFFVLCKKHSKHFNAKFKGVHTFYKPDSVKVIQNKLNSFINDHGLSTNDIDLIVLGQQDKSGDTIYREVRSSLFTNSMHTYYKHLCGEYNTSTAFASWLAAKILKHQTVPKHIILKNELNKKHIKNILIYNHVRNIYHAMILLSSCD
jgi:hypothetical protein